MSGGLLWGVQKGTAEGLLELLVLERLQREGEIILVGGTLALRVPGLSTQGAPLLGEMRGGPLGMQLLINLLQGAPGLQWE